MMATRITRDRVLGKAAWSGATGNERTHFGYDFRNYAVHLTFRSRDRQIALIKTSYLVGL